MNSLSITPTLEQIVKPLIDQLNVKYSTTDGSEYLVPLLGQIGVLETNPDELSIELPDDLPNHEPAMTAVATLLRACGSECRWGGRTIPCGDDHDAPLRIGLVKRVGWAGYFWARARYLVIDHPGDELDVDLAIQQVARLVALLADPANLLELSPEERALF